MTCLKSHSKQTIELRLKTLSFGTKRESWDCPLSSPILNRGQEGGDSPEDEWRLALGFVPAHLASNNEAPVKCQALGRGLQTLASWSARDS